MIADIWHKQWAWPMIWQFLVGVKFFCQDVFFFLKDLTTLIRSPVALVMIGGSSTLNGLDPFLDTSLVKLYTSIYIGIPGW